MAPLSNKQGYELARIGTERGLPVELQRLIWADVTKNYYLRGSVTERAATLLQAAWRRLGTTMSHWRRLRVMIMTMPLSRGRQILELHDLRTAYRRYQRDRVAKSLGFALRRRRQPPPMP
jgi:hypothetical protein